MRRRGFHSLIARHDVGQRLFEGKLLDVANLVVGELERRHHIVLGDQDALDEKLLLIGLVGGDLIGQVGLPKARILRRQQDRAFQDAVAHRLETFLRAVHGHEQDLPLPTAARDDLRGGHGQAIAVAVDQIERGVGGHPVFSDRDRLGRIPVGGVLRDDLDAWISRHHVGEAAGAAVLRPCPSRPCRLATSPFTSPYLALSNCAAYSPTIFPVCRSSKPSTAAQPSIFEWRPMIGTPAAAAFFIVGPKAPASMKLIAMASTPSLIRFSTAWICLFTSPSPLVTIKRKPKRRAASLAPSTSPRWKGLLRSI